MCIPNPVLIPSLILAWNSQHVLYKHADKAVSPCERQSLQQCTEYMCTRFISYKYVYVWRRSVVQIMHRVRKPVNKHSLWYVKLAKCVSSPSWSTYASHCHSTEYFSDDSGLSKETSALQVNSAQNMHIETLTLDSLSWPQRRVPLSLWRLWSMCGHLRHFTMTNIWDALQRRTTERDKLCH